MVSDSTPDYATPTSLELAEAAYRGYAENTGGKTFDGQDMFSWDKLPDRAVKAWVAAAVAIQIETAAHASHLLTLVSQQRESRNNRAFGLEVELQEGEEITQPLAVLVVVKHLNADAVVEYSARASDGVSTVEALGMARYATLKLEQAIWNLVDNNDD
jgi:hypothetical protein